MPSPGAGHAAARFCRHRLRDHRSAVVRERRGADRVHFPDLFVHTPGVSNVLADVLSRKHDPQYAESWSLPPALLQASRVELPAREPGWWAFSTLPA